MHARICSEHHTTFIGLSHCFLGASRFCSTLPLRLIAVPTEHSAQTRRLFFKKIWRKLEPANELLANGKRWSSQSKNVRKCCKTKQASYASNQRPARQRGDLLHRALASQKPSSASVSQKKKNTPPLAHHLLHHLFAGGGGGPKFTRSSSCLPLCLSHELSRRCASILVKHSHRVHQLFFFISIFGISNMNSFNSLNSCPPH